MAVKESSKLTEGEEIILRSMFPKGREQTIKEIQKKTPYSSYERNNNYLKSLARKRIIEEKKIGKTLVYSIIPDILFSQQAFHAYAFDRLQEFSEKHKIISQALKELPQEKIELVLIFGSYAKGAERKESDIDVLVVYSNKEAVEHALTSLKRRYGLQIHPAIIPKSEFAKIKTENKELWESFVMHGILFKGYELFYHYAYAT